MIRVPTASDLAVGTDRTQKHIGLAITSGLRRGVEDQEPSLTFKSFVGNSNPQFRWYRHCEVLGNILEKVVAGELKRVMVFMPPRHGKSETISRYFPAYFLRKHPDRWVGICSHTADLAYGFSRVARDSYSRDIDLRADVAAVKEWQTGKGGGMWAAGVGGSITGKGFHLGIIDDPLKNADEARSKLTRENQKDWYSSTFYTREEPGGAIIVVQTRWNEDDLAGWLLSEEDNDDYPEKWHIVNFEAIREDDSKEDDRKNVFPACCSVEPDWRRPGEALCPERYPLEKLNKIRKRVRSYYWGALYQQRPRPQDGDLCKREWFKFVDEAPESDKNCRFWDTAATEGDGDFTVGTLATKAHRKFYIVDQKAGQWSSGMRDKIIKQTAKTDRAAYGGDLLVLKEEEGGASGKDSAAAFVSMLEGYSVGTRLARGSKATRWDPFLAQLENGNVYLVKGAWNKAFIDEMCDLPYGKHDDRADSASGAVAALCDDDEMLPPAEIL